MRRVSTRSISVWAWGAFVSGFGFLCVALAGDASAVEYRFYHPDALGSNALVTDREGDVVQRTVTEPYGGLRSRTDGSGESIVSSADEVRHLFTDQEFDPESDLLAFGARQYDPAVGRFLSVDPALIDLGESFEQVQSLPGALNGHSYSANRPTALIDPTGRFSVQALVSPGGFGNAMNVRLMNVGANSSLDDPDSLPKRDQEPVQQPEEDPGESPPKPGRPRIEPTKPQDQFYDPVNQAEDTLVVQIDIAVDRETTKDQIRETVNGMLRTVSEEMTKRGKEKGALVLRPANDKQSQRKKFHKAINPGERRHFKNPYRDPLVLKLGEPEE